MACIRAVQGDQSAARDAVTFAELALSHLEAGQVRLILVGGAPGTAKTTVASAVADRLGATHLSTDAVRQGQRRPQAERYTRETKTAT